MTVDELPKIKGSLQFRLLTNTGTIVDLLNKPNCFKFESNTGSAWANSLATGKDLNMPVDVVRLEFGNNQPHSNVSPAIACYVWTRTA